MRSICIETGSGLVVWCVDGGGAFVLVSFVFFRGGGLGFTSHCRHVRGKSEMVNFNSTLR